MSLEVPSFLANQTIALNQEVQLGLAGINMSDRKDRLPPVLSPDDIVEYASQKSPQEMTNDLTPFIKRKETLPPGDFSLLPVTGSGTNYSESDGYMWADGKLGFLLAYQKPDDQYEYKLASVTFSSSTNLLYYWPQIDNTRIVPNSIMIQQLQAYYYFKTKSGSAKQVASQDVLKRLKWERYLVNTTTNWARENSLKAVYIQPAELNDYKDAFDDTEQSRFKMRYDITAERMGFKKDAQGLWGLLLV